MHFSSEFWLDSPKCGVCNRFLEYGYGHYYFRGTIHIEEGKSGLDGKRGLDSKWVCCSQECFELLSLNFIMYEKPSYRKWFTPLG